MSGPDLKDISALVIFKIEEDRHKSQAPDQAQLFPVSKSHVI